MEPTRSSALAEHLVALFSEPELRHFLTSVGEQELLAALPSSSPPQMLAYEAVAALERRGYINRDFFELLLARRPGRAGEIENVRAQWDDALSVAARMTERPEAPQRQTLADVSSFVRPEARRTDGGLRLIDVRPGPREAAGAPLPVLRFTLKNESSGSLTLTTVVVDAICHESWAVLSVPRPIAPSAAWDLELPESGGQRIFFAEPVYVLPPDAVHMLEIRCHVLRTGAQKVPPGHCGRHTLRFGFVAGEGASAFSEPIPC